MTDAPKILAIETTLDGCGIGFIHGDTIDISYEAMTRGQSEVLIPRAKELCERHGVTLDELNAVTVTLGPGSFTGARVGLAAAQGISYAARIPCMGYSTLDIVSSYGKGKAVALDSKRGDAFYQDKNTNPQILSYDEVRQKAGQSLLTNIVDLEGTAVEGKKVVQALLKKAAEDFVAGEKITQVHLAPIYLRGAEVSKSKTKYREIG